MQNGKRLVWEDFSVGRVWTHGYYPVHQEEIIAFATKYDPLNIHTDPIAAHQSPLGVFCTSGVHTLAMAQRMLCEAFFLQTDIVAGGSIDSFRMRIPVVPGDRLHVRAEVEKAWPHARKPDCGWVTMRVDVLRQDRSVVLKYLVTVLIQRSEAVPAVSTLPLSK